ncbi:MAG: nickel insertion protein [Sumerlaeia bacterium]
MISEQLIVIQCDIDDDTAENLACFQQNALKSGARDCALLPVYMKKNRLGTRIEVLCKPEEAEFFQTMLLTQTTTIGFRVLQVERLSLPRNEVLVELQGCEIRCKAVYLQEQFLRLKPEHDDCLAAATALNQPVAAIKALAIESAMRKLKSST